MTTLTEPGTGVLGTVGATPLVALTRLATGHRLYAKLESANPGGSIKDRTALAMLTAAIADGTVVPGRTTLVESSSGNLGIGLAQACRYHGVRFLCVVDPRANKQNVAVMRALGAEVECVTTRDALTGEYLPVRKRRVRELMATIPDAYCPDQYANPRNALAHRTTMREIVDALAAPPDYLVCTVSTCGTLRGCAEYVQENGLATRVIAVDAESSAIFRPAVGQRLIPGHGAATPPALLRAGLADEVVHVSDWDAVRGCRLLAEREAVLAGGSSGAAISATLRLLPTMPAGSTCAVILPDTGTRYLDTIFDDEWVMEHFGEVPVVEPLVLT